MTAWQFVGACFLVYGVIHLHKKYGLSIFKVFALEALIGIGIAAIVLVAYVYLKP
uniref:Uncharacterized protein n=1 Tax=Dulem virus 50 TaxID=3145761 RepID=A0AAU8B1K8_9VIRU